ncbi:SRPBCC domain-containing protein [Streptomyces sp. NBC_01515]|uniref:SRPBCC family protein n=1 Tax=Streptomyces sp. NBC_01515 TaxID=2903890 RepID=UPI0038631AAD
MSAIHIVREYPHPPQRVWRAVTDPELIPLWTATGAGGRPEDFATTVGTTFKFIAKPKPGWSGVVVCKVLEVRESALLRYSWQDEGGGEVTEVAYRLEAHGSGTRFTYDHTGFTGAGGFFMARILGSVRTKMLATGLPAVLNDLDGQGALRPENP